MNMAYSSFSGHGTIWTGFISCVLYVGIVTFMFSNVECSFSTDKQIHRTKRLSTAERTAIDTGFIAGQAIAESLGSKDFKSSMAKFGANIAPFLGLVGPFIGVILTFTSSAEDSQYQKLMTQIDNQFNKMNNRFQDIEREIDWNAVKMNLANLENTILTFVEELKLLYQIKPEGRNNRKSIFIAKYDNSFHDAGYKLYTLITRTSSIYQTNLVEAIIKYTKYHLGEIEIFLSGIMKFLLQAVRIELSYYKMKNFTTNLNFMTQKWTERLRKVQTKFLAIDSKVKENYHKQSREDLTYFLAQYSALSHKEFSQKFYNHLESKFPWREWVVVVYNPVKGTHHAITVCHGHIILYQNGRHVAVASIEEGATRMDFLLAGSTAIQASKPQSLWGHMFGEYAQTVYDRLKNYNIKNVCLMAAIDTSANTQITTVKSFFYQGPTNMAILWG